MSGKMVHTDCCNILTFASDTFAPHDMAGSIACSVCAAPPLIHSNGGAPTARLNGTFTDLAFSTTGKTVVHRGHTPKLR
jgi:hypothetical protein